MKNAALFISVIFVMSTISLFSAPKIKFDCGYIYDWGMVKQKDSPLKADIVMYNKGTETLEVKRVKPMCGCTTAPLSKKSIPPGDSAILKVTLNVEHYEGAVEKKIIISSNTISKETTLILRANVYIPIKLFPSKYLNFGQMYINNETVSKLVINNYSPRNVNVDSVIVTGPDISVNIDKGSIIPQDSDYVLEAIIKPTVTGTYSCKINIFTDDPDIPELTISGFGRVDPESEKINKPGQVNIEAIDQTKVKLITPPPNLDPNSAPVNIQPVDQINIQNNPNMQAIPDNQLKFQAKPQELHVSPGNNTIKLPVEPMVLPEDKPLEQNKENKPPEKEEPVKKK